MKNERTSPLLKSVARKVSGNQFFLAESFAKFRAFQGITEDELALFLEVNPGLLSKLALCRRPDVDSQRFRSDVENIAVTFAIPVGRLVQLIREVDTFKALAEVSPSKQEAPNGLLAVARDDDHDDSHEVDADKSPKDDEDSL